VLGFLLMVNLFALTPILNSHAVMPAQLGSNHRAPDYGFPLFELLSTFTKVYAFTPL